MALAFTMQAFQDWFTQQWVILWGRKIDPGEFAWLVGPFGELNGIGEGFIDQLAQKENLSVERSVKSKGLLGGVGELEFCQHDLERLSQEVIRFYERTADYKLTFQVRWNPFFKPFGFVVNRLFSRRINQLNIPLANGRDSGGLSSEIIKLIQKDTGEVTHTIWLRKDQASGQVVYSGIYGTCRLPSGGVCVKAVFPLPKGNATVILKPLVTDEGSLVLDSSGKRFGDAGFYFLLNDSRGRFWAQYISSFTDRLTVSERASALHARQSLRLWGLRVADFDYAIDADDVAK